MLCHIAADTAAVGHMTSIVSRTYSLVKSDVGLMVILFAYAFLGGVVLHFAEKEREQQRIQQLVDEKRSCVSGIVNASVAAFSKLTGTYIDIGDWYQNLSVTVDAFISTYVHHKEHLRPISSAPQWSYWGAVFFCGTVFTTIGLFSMHRLLTMNN